MEGAEQAHMKPRVERISVTVTNPGQTVTDYQARVNLDSSFRFDLAKIDGSDVRIAADDGITLLPFWIES
jgi:hypothetical protein